MLFEIRQFVGVCLDVLEVVLDVADRVVGEEDKGEADHGDKDHKEDETESESRVGNGKR